MDEGLRARPRCVERKPEASQAAKCRPWGSTLPVSHRQVLGETREEHIPPLVADRLRRVGQQSLTHPGRLPVVLLQELNDQPPPHAEVSLVRDEGGEPGDASLSRRADTRCQF